MPEASRIILPDYRDTSLPRLSDDFRDFLIEAKTNGYGSENAQKTQTDSGAYQITYERNGFRYVDDYVGGVPYSGKEHVSVREEDGLWLPVWAMSYEGDILDNQITAEQLGAMLSRFLAKKEPQLPIRGPFSDYTPDKNFRYRLMHAATTTSLEQFDATERIYDLNQGNRIVYTGRFLGKLINRNLGADKTRAFDG